MVHKSRMLHSIQHLCTIHGDILIHVLNGYNTFQYRQFDSISLIYPFKLPELVAGCVCFPYATHTFCMVLLFVINRILNEAVRFPHFETWKCCHFVACFTCQMRVCVCVCVLFAIFFWLPSPAFWIRYMYAHASADTKCFMRSRLW